MAWRRFPVRYLDRMATDLSSHPMPQPTCRACGTTTTGSVAAREMMFGLRDEFTYDECGGCGCVQLRNPPADPARFYGGGYYSLQPLPRRGRLWELVRRGRNALMYRNPLGLGRVLARILPKFPDDKVDWMALTGTGRDARILDVGAGSGLLVRDLAEAGFRRVLGIDPFVDVRAEMPEGGRVVRQTLDETSGSFDLIMFHHSLEHVPDQLGALRRAAELLAPGGWCLVRVPVTSSFAWRHYREHWVQLDAPRHYVLHSVASLHQLAAKAGLEVAHVVHDSTSLQFFGSEAYRRDVPLGEAEALFTPAELRAFERRAVELNARGDGDQACFYLRHARPVSAPH